MTSTPTSTPASTSAQTGLEIDRAATDTAEFRPPPDAPRYARASSAATDSRDWPHGPLDAAERAFVLLTRPPAPLAFDCRAVPGLRPAIVDLADLRRILLARQPPPGPVIDLIWRELVVRARRDGPAWVVAAVGVALPGLRRRAGLLARGWTGERADLDSELLLGFLECLAVLDVDAPNVCARLIDAGARAVKRSRRHSEAIEVAVSRLSGSVPPARPWDHPDLVLARAVRAAVISSEDAAVISATRLGETTVSHIAERLDTTVSAVLSARKRAERRLAEAINAGELRWAHLP